MTTTVGRLRTLHDVDVEGKRVLVRVDFNVPMDKTTGAISDDTRIRAALPTISYLRSRDAKIILASHLGRPKGNRVDSVSLEPVAQRLSELTDVPVRFANDCVGPEVEAMIAEMKPGNVLLLENLRFHPEEEANDPDFSRQLAQLADVYVNDAFGTAHRAHASTEGIAHKLPGVGGIADGQGDKGAGRGTRASGPALHGHHWRGQNLDQDRGPEASPAQGRRLIIGGGMANTFLAANGHAIGTSLVESDQLDVARELIAGSGASKVLLPEDVVVSMRCGRRRNADGSPADGVPKGWSIVDIGPKAIERSGQRIDTSKTILWNGPMGIFEVPAFAKGTLR